MAEMFTWNGVSLDRISEPAVEREYVRNRDGDIAIPCLLALAGSFIVAVLLDLLVDDSGARVFGKSMLAIAALVSAFASAAGFYSRAQEDNQLPSSSNAIPPATHVSGLGAAIILGIAICLIAAAYFGQSSSGHIRIPEWLGLFVVILFCALFLWIFLISRIFTFASIQGARRVLERLFAPFVPLGRFFSRVDALLVFVIAPLYGATLKGAALRYLVLFSNVLGATLFAWVASAPIGLVGSAWALLGIISVSRRWSWIETERNRTLLDPAVKSFDLRIGIEDDLRDEAVLSLLVLVVALPIAMRQVHLGFPSLPVFIVDDPSINKLDAWVGFFGVELLKALPFLDWADVYDAQAVTRVETSSALSMHLVLVSRALLDLLFISALFQSIAISVSLAKNRSDFLSRRPGVDQLDPRIELRELTSLAVKVKGGWRFRSEINGYSHYNLRRLSKLRLGAPQGSRLRAVIDKILEISGREVVPPAEQLVNLTANRRFEAKELSAVLAEIDDSADYDLDFLAIARRQLNRRGGMEAERKRIVQMIVSKIAPGIERERELAEILRGPDADSLANIRVIVVPSLARNAKLYEHNRATLSLALVSDRSKAVRQTIQKEMVRHSIRPIRLEYAVSIVEMSGTSVN